MVFITPTDITPASSGSWVEKDLSAYIPYGSTGVILHIYDDGGTNPTNIGFRKKGSTDNRTDEMGQSKHFWAAIGVDSNRKLELYIGNTTTMHVKVVGYFGSEATFFTNAVDKTPATLDSWQDVNISSDTGSATAIGAIFEVVNGHFGFGLRKNGSTDNRTDATREHIGGIIGVDASEICEAYLGDATPFATVKLWLVGYITGGATFNTNATDISPATAGSWQDIVTLASGARGAIIEVQGAFSNDAYGLRKNGSTEDIYKDIPNTHAFGMVEGDTSRIIEGKAEDADDAFFLVGYFTAPPATTTSTSTSTTSSSTSTSSSTTTSAHTTLTSSSTTSTSTSTTTTTSTSSTSSSSTTTQLPISNATPNKKIVFRVSKPGYDVLSDTDPEHMAVDSEYNHLKTFKSGTFTVTVAAGSNNITTIAHNLGYKPLAMCYFRNTANNNWFINNTEPAGAAIIRYSGSVNVSMYFDDTNAYFKLTNDDASPHDIEVKYEIFYEGD